MTHRSVLQYTCNKDGACMRRRVLRNVNRTAAAAVADGPLRSYRMLLHVAAVAAAAAAVRQP